MYLKLAKLATSSYLFLKCLFVKFTERKCWWIKSANLPVKRIAPQNMILQYSSHIKVLLHIYNNIIIVNGQ